MKVLLSWLKEFAPFTAPAETLAEDLAELGLSVEELKQLKPDFSDVVVAEVLELKSHPKADRIQLVEVGLGGGQTQQVCCGAFNMSVGDLVPLAKVGAALPNDLKIKSRKIRGELSEGMICSALELDMGSDDGGIMILPANLELGIDVADALELGDDTLFDIEVNPNRPDAMSVVGVARDLAAKQRVPFSIPKPSFTETKEVFAKDLCKANILDPELCGHFSLRVLTDVKIQDSPPEIAKRLLACGMRPLNNIVDFSNYVMLELGQPTHSFDLDKLQDGVLNIRMAKEGEKITTIDNIERKLTSKDGVITDATDSLISIAGVMGGTSTEISQTTTRVVMEAAWWKPLTIAQTSRRMGLRSEASARFDRGVDTQIAELALNRIAELAQGMGATIIEGICVEKGNLPAPPKVVLHQSEIKRHLGIDLEMKEANQLLESIGFKTKKLKKSSQVQVPSFRPDIEIEIDLIEEVARMYGYGKFPRNVPRFTTAGGLTQRQTYRRQVMQTLKGFGLLESISIPFLEQQEIEQAGFELQSVKISNSSIDTPVHLRTSLMPGILRTLAYNFAHQNQDMGLFEVGVVFEPSSEELPIQNEHLAIALAGKEPLALASQITGILNKVDFEIKNAENQTGLHPVRAAKIFLENQEIGYFGQVDKKVCDNFKLQEPVSYAEFNLSLLLDYLDKNKKTSYSPPSKYPSSNFDLAFWVDDDVSAGELKGVLQEVVNPVDLDGIVKLRQPTFPSIIIETMMKESSILSKLPFHSTGGKLEFKSSHFWVEFKFGDAQNSINKEFDSEAGSKAMEAQKVMARFAECEFWKGPLDLAEGVTTAQGIDVKKYGPGFKGIDTLLGGGNNNAIEIGRVIDITLADGNDSGKARPDGDSDEARANQRYNFRDLDKAIEKMRGKRYTPSIFMSSEMMHGFKHLERSFERSVDSHEWVEDDKGTKYNGVPVFKIGNDHKGNPIFPPTTDGKEDIYFLDFGLNAVCGLHEGIEIDLVLAELSGAPSDIWRMDWKFGLAVHNEHDIVKLTGGRPWYE